jgi:hypothetical protein
MHTTTEELLEAVFAMHCSVKLYREGQQDQNCEHYVEAGTNTSSIALQVVEGDKKGMLCLGI